MKYEIEKIVNYCQDLFEKYSNNIEIIYNVYKKEKDIKLSVTCRSYAYDITIDKRNLLWLKAKGLVKMTTRVIDSSFGVFGTETNFVFIIDKYKLSIRRGKSIVIRLILFRNLFCNESFSKKFVLYAVNKLPLEIFYLTTKEIDYYYHLFEKYQYSEIPMVRIYYLYYHLSPLDKIGRSIEKYFKTKYRKIINDTNTVYKKVQVLKKGVIQLPNGKFIKKTKKRVLNIKSHMTPYKWVNDECVSGIDIYNMTDKEKSIMVDYFLGLSDEGKDVIEKYSVTKLDLDKIRQLNK